MKATFIFLTVLMLSNVLNASEMAFPNECSSANPDGLPLSCSSHDSDWINNSCRIRCLEDQTPVCNPPILTKDGTVCGKLTPASCYCVLKPFN